MKEEVRTMTHNQIKIQMKSVIAVNETEPESDTNDVESENKKQKLDNDVMDWLEDVLEPQDSCTFNAQTDPIDFEMLRYLNEPCCKVDALVWWKQKESMFPLLSQLARKFLCVPASSVPSERIFSTAGHIVNKKRACLSAENVNMLISLNKNSGKL